MAKLRMAHASTHGARKPPGPINVVFSHTLASGPTLKQTNSSGYLFMKHPVVVVAVAAAVLSYFVNDKDMAIKNF